MRIRSSLAGSQTVLMNRYSTLRIERNCLVNCSDMVFASLKRFATITGSSTRIALVMTSVFIASTAPPGRAGAGATVAGVGGAARTSTVSVRTWAVTNAGAQTAEATPTIAIQRIGRSLRGRHGPPGFSPRRLGARDHPPNPEASRSAMMIPPCASRVSLESEPVPELRSPPARSNARPPAPWREHPVS